MPDMTWTVIVGLAVGVLSRLILRQRTGTGLFMTVVLAVLGSFAGGFVGIVTGFASAGDSASIAMSVLGAFAFLFVRRLAGD